MEIKRIVLISLMTAVLCVVSPFAITIAISPVPISLATFAIYLIVMLLGRKDGTISVLLYVLLGFAGAPVFTGFTGGVGKVLGPTGGYIIGYVFLALIEGIFVDGARGVHETHPHDGRVASDGVSASAVILFGMFIGTIVLYLFGTIWLAKQANMTFAGALLAGVVPFIAGDIIKMLVATLLGREIIKVLHRSKLI